MKIPPLADPFCTCIEYIYVNLTQKLKVFLLCVYTYKNFKEKWNEMITLTHMSLPTLLLEILQIFTHHKPRWNYIIRHLMKNNKKSIIIGRWLLRNILRDSYIHTLTINVSGEIILAHPKCFFFLLIILTQICANYRCRQNGSLHRH